MLIRIPILGIALFCGLWLPGQDTEKNLQLLSQADSLKDASSYDSALVLYQELLEVSTKTGNHKLKVKTLNGLGLTFIDLSKYDLAESNLKEAIALGSRHLDPQDPVLGESYTRLGYCFTKQRKIDTAIDHYNIALDIFTKSLGATSKQVGGVYSRLGVAYYLLGNSSEKAIEYLLKSLSIYQELPGEHLLDIARVYNDLANVYQDQHEYEKALEYHFNSLSAKQKMLGNLHPETGVSSYNLGRVYYSMGDYYKALEYLQKTLEVDLHTFGENHIWVGEDHYSIADCYMAYGDYDLALKHAQISADILRESVGSNHSRYATPLLTTGQAYLNLEQPEEALRYFREALDIFLQNKEVNRDILAGKAAANALIGVALLKMDQFQLAIDHLNRSINSGLTTMVDQANFVAESYRNIGYCYTELGQFDDAWKSFEQSLSVLTDAFGPHHPEIAETYQAMGDAYLENDQATKALNQYQTALAALVPGLAPDYSINPTLPQLSTLPTTLEILSQKAWAFRKQYQAEDNPIYLERSHETLQLAISLIDTLRVGFLEQGSKQSLLENHLRIYERSLSVVKELYEVKGSEMYLASAFQIMEKSKSFMLLSTIRETAAKQFANIPDALIETETDLKAKLAFYETQARVENDDQKKGLWRSKAFRFRKSYDSLMHAISNSHPEYHALKYNTEVATLNSVRAQVTENEALIIYFMGDSTLYALAVDSRELVFYSNPVTDDFNNQVQLLRDCLNQKLSFSKEFALASHQLYQQLIGPTAGMIQNKNVTIVPDGVLNYFPFEILSTTYTASETGFMDLPYLIFDINLNYAFSSTSLMATKQREKPDRNFNYLAFAPEFNKRSSLAVNGSTSPVQETVRGTLAELKGTKRETGVIARYFTGQLFQDAAATESQFKRAAPESDIIHLATHAIVDDQNPLNSRLLFTISEDSVNDGDLHVWELYNMQLNAQMAVLSACNTGYGKLERGEGVMSLGRAFAYAGCPSIVMSLWPAQDEATADIMELFYQGIADGLTKDHALAAAKREYLKRSDDLFSHPFYWAGFISQGDPKPVIMSGATNLWTMLWYVLIFLALLLVTVGLSKRYLGANNQSKTQL